MKGRALEPDAYMSLVHNQPKFESTEVMSQTSTTDAFVKAGGDDEYHEFEKFQHDTWMGALATTVSQIGQDAKSSTLPTASLGAVRRSIKKEK